MAFATVHYYNKNKFRVTIMGDDNNSYYLAPRTFTFVAVALKDGFTLPPGVVTYANPAWFKEVHWPFYKPWETNPETDPQPGP